MKRFYRISAFLFILLFALNGTVIARPALQTDFCQTVTDIPRAECEALAAFYASTGGDGWNVNSGWLTDTEAASWYGVQVVDNRVARLTLANNNLQGSLPPEIGTLSGLTEIVLSRNQLSGSLPSAIGGLNQLTILDLSSNDFSGGLPPELFTLTSLQYLYLDHNQFSGVIPAAIGNLTALNVLWLNDNHLLGFPPAGLTNLTALFNPGSLQPGNLDGLDLNENRFCVPDGYPVPGNPLHQFLSQKDPDFHLHQTCTPIFEVFLPMIRR